MENKKHKFSIETEYIKGDTVFFVLYDKLQKTTIKMVLVVVSGDEKDELKPVYILDETKIIMPKAQRKYNYKFENHFSAGALYRTADEAVAALLKEEGDDNGG